MVANVFQCEKGRLLQAAAVVKRGKNWSVRPIGKQQRFRTYIISRRLFCHCLKIGVEEEGCSLQSIDRQELTPIQQTIMSCVRDEPGHWSRSSLAKLLVGSKSSRSVAMVDHTNYGRLANHGRKEIAFKIDILIQQHLLFTDHQGKLVLASERSHLTDTMDIS